MHIGTQKRLRVRFPFARVRRDPLQGFQLGRGFFSFFGPLEVGVQVMGGAKVGGSNPPRLWLT